MEFVEELLDPDHEEEQWGNPVSHLIAGAIAGCTEHIGMFPIDTVKTRIQAFSEVNKNLGIIGTTREIVAERGVSGLFRGVSAIAAGAAPAHAIYFASYEFFKNQFGGFQPGHHPFATASAGILATTMSDAVLTPMDAVKQKMQLGMRSYSGFIDCVKTTYKLYGLRGFYAGYTTTLTMNVPYTAIYFASYESLKKYITKNKSLSEHSAIDHFLAGGGAGILASGFTNPLDVAKTRLQTQGDSGKLYQGMTDAVAKIWREEGMRGYLKGIRPRMMFHSMAAAICWCTYEAVKKVMAPTSSPSK
eukprot:TRINITY_DN2372_c0_g1_i1.p1 TRINITY_DN2372_c0_g1~~TRINITY_DN2372_c0_g1_i1.p1  ORF type:complete len:315 (+),score=52.97 TRINITY_DN2372_c0_g1_i1:38-946(+)